MMLSMTWTSDGVATSCWWDWGRINGAGIQRDGDERCLTWAVAAKYRKYSGDNGGRGVTSGLGETPQQIDRYVMISDFRGGQHTFLTKPQNCSGIVVSPRLLPAESYIRSTAGISPDIPPMRSIRYNRGSSPVISSSSSIAYRMQSYLLNQCKFFSINDECALERSVVDSLSVAFEIPPENIG